MNRRGFIGTIAALTALANSKPEPVSPSYEMKRSLLIPDPSVTNNPIGNEECRRWDSIYIADGPYDGLLKHKER